jgi:hypothetical protein
MQRGPQFVEVWPAAQFGGAAGMSKRRRQIALRGGLARLDQRTPALLLDRNA